MNWGLILIRVYLYYLFFNKYSNNTALIDMRILKVLDSIINIYTTYR